MICEVKLELSFLQCEQIVIVLWLPKFLLKIPNLNFVNTVLML